MEKIDKISVTLSQPNKNIRLRFHVVLNSTVSDKKLNRVFELNDKSYLSLEPTSFFTLECMKQPWEKEKSFLINEKNIYKVARAFKLMNAHIYQVDDIFVMDKEKKLYIDKSVQKKYTEIVEDYWRNQKMLMVPDVVYDDEGVSYEGVVIYFNKTENFVELSLEEFESVFRILKNADLFSYTMSVLTYYNSMKVEIDLAAQEKTIRESIRHINIFKDVQPINNDISVVKSEFNDANDLFKLN